MPGVGTQAECGNLVVPENRLEQGGRTIRLHLAVLRSLAATPAADPLFLLVGGPGQSATVSGAPMAQLFARIRRKRDLVLLDQRGTGHSNPLKCDKEAVSLQDMFSEGFAPGEVSDCLAGLDADPTQYTTSQAVEDLEQVRRALGYDEVSLWGASYGTRVALAYVAQYGSHVRRVVLDGPVPTDVKLPLYAGRDAQRALDRVFSDCASQPSCASRFPHLKATFEELLHDLSASPKSIVVAHPRTGKPERVTLNRDGFASGLRMLLYAPYLSALVPLALTRAREGDFGVFISAVASIGDQIDQDLYYGMFLSVVCSEDVPRITEAEMKEQTRGNFLGSSSLENLRKACALWPEAHPPKGFFAPVRNDVPTLVLSGRDDPIVPPVWGELVTGRLSRAQHVVVEGAAHGTSAIGCVTSAITEFIESRSVDPLEVPCASRLRRPPFFTSNTGAAP